MYLRERRAQESAGRNAMKRSTEGCSSASCKRRKCMCETARPRCGQALPHIHFFSSIYTTQQHGKKWARVNIISQSIRHLASRQRSSLSRVGNQVFKFRARSNLTSQSQLRFIRNESSTHLRRRGQALQMARTTRVCMCWQGAFGLCM